jgi:hypothetical protein
MQWDQRRTAKDRDAASAIRQSYLYMYVEVPIKNVCTYAYRRRRRGRCIHSITTSYYRDCDHNLTLGRPPDTKTFGSAATAPDARLCAVLAPHCHGTRSSQPGARERCGSTARERCSLLYGTPACPELLTLPHSDCTQASPASRPWGGEAGTSTSLTWMSPSGTPLLMPWSTHHGLCASCHVLACCWLGGWVAVGGLRAAGWLA